MVIRHVVGLDLGQVNDYTALCVLRRTPAEDDEAEAHYDCVHLKRYPRRTPYPAIVDDVAQMLSTPEMRPTFSIEPTYPRTAFKHVTAPIPLLAVDATGCGRPVVDLFLTKRLEAEMVPIVITGGNEVNPERWDGPDGETASGFKVPKRDLVGVSQALLQTGRLKIVDSLPDADILRREMLNFKAKISISAHETYEAHREGDHDDLVLAVAMACWLGQRPTARASFGPHPFAGRSWTDSIL